MGAGGLIRAYGAAARQVLRQSPTVTWIPKRLYVIDVPSASMSGAVYDIIVNKCSQTATLVQEHYNDDGSFRLKVHIQYDTVSQIEQLLLDSTRGNAQLTLFETRKVDDKGKQG